MRKIYVYIICISTVLVSCSRNIPENTLVSILYEMYLTDAVTSAKVIANEDSVKVYEPIVKKYGYKLEDVNKTMLNYAIMDGKLDSIYNKLNRRIESEKLIYKPLARIEKLSANLYVGADSMTLNSTFHSRRTIDLLLEETGVYYISASYYLFADDSTRNPRMSVWLESSTRDSLQWQEIAMVKDTLFQDYSFRIEFKDEKYNRLKGFWLNYDEAPKKNLLEPVSVNSINKDLKNKNKPKKPLKREEEIKRYQHCTIRRMLIKYNFEESDTILKADTVLKADTIQKLDIKNKKPGFEEKYDLKLIK